MPSNLPILAQSSSIIHPVAILVLCVVAGVGTVLLLPGKRERSISKIGGVIVLAAFLVLAALMVRQAASHGAGDVYFWIFSLIAVVGAVRVITHRKPVYSALYFVLVVMASAGLFVLLWAEFMAAALILIYAGAILITYVFVIMLASQAQNPSETTQSEGAEYDVVSREPLLASAAGFALMGVILFLIFQKNQAIAELPEPVGTREVRGLGKYLFEKQLIGLELAGLILTVSMVGAVIIARRQVATEDVGAGFEPTHVSNKSVTDGPDDNPHTIPIYGTDNPAHKAYPER